MTRPDLADKVVDIASISAVEGKNWRHGDIEDMLKTIAFIKHHKWTGMMIKRVYFGNWLRDYSQAMDVGTLKKTQAETIRILVWVLSLLSFGYATAEFEVTSERLGVYRPEEHIDNPKDYADNEDARKYDPRLRGPVRQIELDIDPETGMKNYIANERGDWATSAGFVKYSFTRSIHYGRLYTSGHGFHKGKDEDLAEALRCLGQGLHTLEDFGAHTNYTELALREMGYNNVFPHVGTSTQINLRGHHVFPLVTGTFGMVDFFHSVLGEASDHFTQSEVNEMDNALGTAQQASKSSNPCTTLVKLLSKVPGTKDLCAEAEQLQHSSQAQARANETGGDQSAWQNQGGFRGLDTQAEEYGSSRGPGDWSQGGNFQQPGWQGPPQGYDQPHQQWDHTQQWQQPPQQWDQSQQWQQPPPPPQHWDQSQPSWQQPQPQQPQQVNQPAPQQQTPQFAPPPTFDPAKTIAQIYPILVFRDKVVRTISSIIEKIPGLEALVDKITETLTIFILSLLAPFIRPIINVVSKQLQTGSGGVVEASGKHQYEPWTNPQCTDPTHSLLSKDHFSNVLNPPAGEVASEILKYVAPRVLYAWQNPDVPVDHVMNEVMYVFHHPAVRDQHIEVHRTMFDAVKRWVDSRKDRGASLNTVLSAESVRAGKNQTGTQEHAGHTHNQFDFAGMGMPAHQQHQSQPQQHAGGGSGGGGWQQQVQHYTEPFLGHGGQHGGQQQHGGSQGPLGQFGNLPIPGLSDVNKKLNKYSKFLPGGLSGGSRRGLDDEDLAAPEVQQQGLHPDAGGAYGGQEARLPSPGPPAPPSGYEQYGQASGSAYQGEYSGGEYYGQGGYGQGGYGQGGHGGAAGDYYR